MEKLFLQQNEEKGITLIALVITIIVLLILAGITIATLTGENGILNRASEAKERTNIAQLKEQIRLDVIEVQAQNNGKVTKGNLRTIAGKYGGTLSEDGTKIIIGDKEIAVSEIYDGMLEKGKLFEEVTAANYGDYVNYNVEIGLDNTASEHKTDWRIFYNDGTNIFLIASDYVQNTKIPTLTELGMTANGTYSVYWSSFKHAGMADVSEETATRYQLGWRAVNSTSENPNAKATAALLDTSKWSYFAGGIAGAEAVGGPTLEMYTKSWNEKGYTKIYCNNSDANGYNLGIINAPASTDYEYQMTDVNSKGGYDDTLYYPHQLVTDNSKCVGYWLASPSAYDSYSAISLAFSGRVGSNSYTTDSRSVRPVVYMPSGITGEKDANGIWQIQ